MWLGYAESSSTWITWHDRLSMPGMSINSGGINSLRVIGNLDTKSIYSLGEPLLVNVPLLFLWSLPPAYFLRIVLTMLILFLMIKPRLKGRLHSNQSSLALPTPSANTSAPFFLNISFIIFWDFVFFWNGSSGARIGYAWRDLSYRAKNISNYYKYRIWGDHRLLRRVYFNDTLI